MEKSEHRIAPKEVLDHRLLDAVSERRRVTVTNLWRRRLFLHDHVEHFIAYHDFGIAELVCKLPLAALETNRMPRGEVRFFQMDEFGATVGARRERDALDRDGVAECGH